MTNNILARRAARLAAQNNAPRNAMLSNDEAAKLIGHNMGDEFDNLGTDVRDIADACKLAKEFRDNATKLRDEATTAKLKALIAAAQMAHTLGLTAPSKPDWQDMANPWVALVHSFTNCKTEGTFGKESSNLKGALTLQAKRLLVPALRHAEQIHLAAKTGGLPVRAVENVFSSVASYARNNDGKMPTLAEVQDKILDKPRQPGTASRPAQPATNAGETAQPEQAVVTVDTIAARFVDNFADVAQNMNETDAENTLAEIIEMAKEKLAALRAEKAAKAKAAEASAAPDVGTKGRKGRRAAQN